MAAPPPKAILAQRSHSSPSSAHTHVQPCARVTTHPHRVIDSVENSFATAKWCLPSSVWTFMYFMGSKIHYIRGLVGNPRSTPQTEILIWTYG